MKKRTASAFYLDPCIMAVSNDHEYSLLFKVKDSQHPISRKYLMDNLRARKVIVDAVAARGLGDIGHVLIVFVFLHSTFAERLRMEICGLMVNEHVSYSREWRKIKEMGAEDSSCGPGRVYRPSRLNGRRRDKGPTDAQRLKRLRKMEARTNSALSARVPFMNTSPKELNMMQLKDYDHPGLCDICCAFAIEHTSPTIDARATWIIADGKLWALAQPFEAKLGMIKWEPLRAWKKYMHRKKNPFTELDVVVAQIGRALIHNGACEQSAKRRGKKRKYSDM